MAEETTTAVVPAAGNYAVSKHATDDAFVEMASSQFIPRLQFCASSSDAAKVGLVPVNNFAVVTGKNQYLILGKTVDVLPLGWRPKALDTSVNPPVAKYNPKDQGFATIQHRSINVQNSKCMFGPEYLLWVPAVKRFVTFLMGSKSTRREAPNMLAILKEGKAATLSSTLADNGTFKWQTPIVHGCSTAWPDDQNYDKEKYDEVVAKFSNPPDSEEELADPAEEAAAQARDR